MTSEPANQIIVICKTRSKYVNNQKNILLRLNAYLDLISTTIPQNTFQLQVCRTLGFALLSQDLQEHSFFVGIRRACQFMYGTGFRALGQHCDPGG